MADDYMMERLEDGDDVGARNFIAEMLSNMSFTRAQAAVDEVDEGGPEDAQVSLSLHFSP